MTGYARAETFSRRVSTCYCKLFYMSGNPLCGKGLQVIRSSCVKTFTTPLGVSQTSHPGSCRQRQCRLLNRRGVRTPRRLRRIVYLRYAGRIDSGTVPLAGSLFSSWSGCDSVSGGVCSVVMSGARSVVANFSIIASMVDASPYATLAAALAAAADGTTLRLRAAMAPEPLV